MYTHTLYYTYIILHYITLYIVATTTETTANSKKMAALWCCGAVALKKGIL